MNIFAIQTDIQESCRELADLDPARARKQLVECCQLLASADHLLLGGTAMTKADGTPYGKAHPHHPITKNMVMSRPNRDLCLQVASRLATIYPDHACSESIRNYVKAQIQPYTDRATSIIKAGTTDTLCVCRRGVPPAYITTLEEYAALLRPYFLAKVAANKGTT